MSIVLIPLSTRTVGYVHASSIRKPRVGNDKIVGVGFEVGAGVSDRVGPVHLIAGRVGGRTFQRASPIARSIAEG